MDEQVRLELSALTSRLAGLEERVKAAYQRIDEQKQLVETVHKLALAMESMTHEQKRLRADVDEIRGRSAKRWDTVFTEVVKLTVAAGVGAVLMRVGLG